MADHETQPAPTRFDPTQHRRAEAKRAREAGDLPAAQRLLTDAAAIANRLGRHADAIQLLREALEIAADSREAAEIADQIAMIAEVGSPDTAAVAWKEAASRWATTDVVSRQARALIQQYWATADNDPSELLEQVIALGQRSGGWQLRAEAIQAQARGEWARSADLDRNALEQAYQHSDPGLEAYALRGLGISAFLLGQIDDAVELLRATLDVGYACTPFSFEVTARMWMMDALLAAADTSEAIEAGRALLHRIQEAHCSAMFAPARANFAACLNAAGLSSDAERESRQAIDELSYAPPEHRASVWTYHAEITAAAGSIDAGLAIAKALYEADLIRHEAMRDDILAAQVLIASVKELDDLLSAIAPRMIEEETTRIALSSNLSRRSADFGRVLAPELLAASIEAIQGSPNKRAQCAVAEARAVTDGIEGDRDVSAELLRVSRMWGSLNGWFDALHCRASASLLSTASPQIRVAELAALFEEAAYQTKEQMIPSLASRLSSVIETACSVPSDAPIELPGLNDSDLVRIRLNAVRSSLAGGEFLSPHSLGERLLIVRSGFVLVASHDEYGKNLNHYLAGPGDVFFEPEGLGKTNQLLAIGDVAIDGLATSLLDHLALSREPLRTYLSESRQAQAARDRDLAMALATQTAQERVLNLIELLAARFGSAQPDGTVSIELGLTQQDLASMVGITRERFVQLLRELRKAGLIDSSPRQIRVLKPKNTLPHVA